MIDRLVTSVSAFIVATISAMGYGGIVLLMAIESACVPLPSEVTMPFSGYLASTGRFDLNLVAIAGAIGCLLGSYVAYFIGASGGRRLLLKYGRYVLIAPHEIELADRFSTAGARPRCLSAACCRWCALLSRCPRGSRGCVCCLSPSTRCSAHTSGAWGSRGLG